MLVTVFKKFGISSEVKDTAQGFLGRIQEVTPDLCFIDLNLDFPGAGYTIIDAVRKLMGASLTLIVVSGVSEKEAIIHAIETGANDFILKPLSRDILAAKISRYVTTEALTDVQSPLLPVPDGGAPATVDLEFEIRAIDEFGLTLVGKHLLAKGASFYFDGKTISEVTASTKPLLMTVVSTWIEEDGLTYGASVDFDRTNNDLGMNIRRWLATCKANKGEG
mgnify:CR=1 FL=1